jgi:diguanylate cyclase (GGDEF)-like protein/PAS domain S-box-containing protein
MSLASNNDDERLPGLPESLIVNLDDQLKLQAAALNATANAVLITDTDGKIIWVNPGFTNLTGYSFGESLGQSPRFLKSGVQDDVFYRDMWKTISSGETWYGEMTNKKKDGTYYIQDFTITPVRDSSGMITNYVGVGQDITERKDIERELRASYKRFQALVEHSADNISLLDAAGKYVDLATDTHRVLGYSKDEIVGKEAYTLVHDDDKELFRSFFDDLVRTPRKTVRIQLRAKHKLGEWRWIEAVGTNLILDPSVRALVFNSRDITERKLAEESIEFKATHDTLTGLPNRALFKDRLSMALSHAERYGNGLSLMFIDLDNFKKINDSLGHLVGDKLLKAVAARLSAVLRHGDTIARIGGDEFIVLLSKINESSDAEEVARKLLDISNQPFKIDGYDIRSALSIGIACYPEDGNDADTLMNRADNALYKAKHKGRNRYQLCSPEFDSRLMQHIEAKERLREAVNNNNLHVVYDPIVNVEGRHVSGAEAVMHWQDGEGAIFPAHSILNTVEHSDLMRPISNLVINKASLDAANWHANGHSHLRITIDVTFGQLDQPDFIQSLEKVLATNHLSPDKIELEISEESFVREPDRILGIIRGLRDRGLGVAIDDFGSHHTPLSYLSKYPITSIKIDKEFNPEFESDRCIIVEALVDTAKKFGINTIASGIENELQFNFVRRIGCDEAQGGYFSKPMSGQDFYHVL